MGDGPFHGTCDTCQHINWSCMVDTCVCRHCFLLHLSHFEPSSDLAAQPKRNLCRCGRKPKIKSVRPINRLEMGPCGRPMPAQFIACDRGRGSFQSWGTLISFLCLYIYIYISSPPARSCYPESSPRQWLRKFIAVDDVGYVNVGLKKVGTCGFYFRIYTVCSALDSLFLVCLGSSLDCVGGF